MDDVRATHRSVLFAMAVNVGQTVALAVAAWITGSSALIAQTVANAADLAVTVFLLIGVLSSTRPPDETHPLGYGRERFFWSLFAALGIFVGGGGVALYEAIGSVGDSSPLVSHEIAYLILAATIALDLITVQVALRPLRQQAAESGISLRTRIKRSTDPAAITVIVAGAAVVGGLVAAAGLMLSQVTGSTLPDTVASALIGLVLLFASVLLLRTNRDLLTGRGVPIPMLREMRQIIAGVDGVIDVPDLFAIAIGPSSFIVDGDVTFADELNVPAVEKAISSAAAALRDRWPSIDYIYLTPVPTARPRRARRVRDL